MLNATLIVTGVILVGLSLNDVFQSVIVPRAVGRRYRPSYYLSRINWTLWPRLAWRIHPVDADKREDFLALFAPLQLVLLLVLWSLLLLLGYGCIFYALSSAVHPTLQNFWQALYFAGSSFFTIGFGDFVGKTGVTRLASLAAGASGFGVISTTTAFLFAIFGAFQQREQFVVVVGARAGIPPSGVGLMVIAAEIHDEDGVSVLMRDGQRWCASILETHLAYPILAYFRSSHDYESWVGTLGTLLDAAVLAITTVECKAAEASILYNIGRHTAQDLASYFRMSTETEDPGISREEFDRACTTLAAAGYTLREADAAWRDFSRLRAGYAFNLNALAHFFAIPPLQWVGDRSSITAKLKPVHSVGTM
jgi:hypothetical protein